MRYQEHEYNNSLKITVDRSQLQVLLTSKEYLKSITDSDPLDPISSLSTEFKDPPPVGQLDIIMVRRPPGEPLWPITLLSTLQ